MLGVCARVVLTRTFQGIEMGQWVREKKRALPRASASVFTVLWLSPHAGDLQHVQQVLRPERSADVAALVESVWPLLLHTTNRLAQQEQGETSRLSQEQVGCPCPFNVAFFAKNRWFSIGTDWHSCRSVWCAAQSCAAPA